MSKNYEGAYDPAQHVMDAENRVCIANEEIARLKAELHQAQIDAQAFESQAIEAETQLEDYEEFCTDDPRALADAIARRVSVFGWAEFLDQLDQNIHMGWVA